MSAMITRSRKRASSTSTMLEDRQISEEGEVSYGRCTLSLSVSLYRQSEGLNIMLFCVPPPTPLLPFCYLCGTTNRTHSSPPHAHLTVLVEEGLRAVEPHGHGARLAGRVSQVVGRHGADGKHGGIVLARGGHGGAADRGGGAALWDQGACWGKHSRNTPV